MSYWKRKTWGETSLQLYSLPKILEPMDNELCFASCIFPDWDWTHNRGMFSDWELNLWPFSLEDDAPTNWATVARAVVSVLNLFWFCRSRNWGLERLIHSTPCYSLMVEVAFEPSGSFIRVTTTTSITWSLAQLFIGLAKNFMFFPVR